MDKKLLADLLEAVQEMEAIREGRAKPARVTWFKALDPRTIRQKVGLTQERFAAVLGVKVATYRNWEQGRRVPHGPAQVLLMVADFDPTIILRAIRARRKEAECLGVAADGSPGATPLLKGDAKGVQIRKAPAPYEAKKRKPATVQESKKVPPKRPRE
jgi:putative transcriptional regulator